MSKSHDRADIGLWRCANPVQHAIPILAGGGLPKIQCKACSDRKLGQFDATRANKILCCSESCSGGLQTKMAACFGAMRSAFFLPDVGGDDLCRQARDMVGNHRATPTISLSADLLRQSSRIVASFVPAALEIFMELPNMASPSNRCFALRKLTGSQPAPKRLALNAQLGADGAL
jgi:hypothetical protein